MTGTDLKHRLAAILAADAAGYSRLMATDERGTVAVLDAARAVFRKNIESNQGRVVDTAGDSVLAVFDTAAGATLAALAIQVELGSGAQNIPVARQLLFRIGLHLGDVIEKADGTVYGDGVNVAARLQAIAEAGGTVMSDSVRNAVRGKVAASFEDLGEQTVKNIAEPVRAYRVRSEGAAATRSTSEPVASVAEIDLSLPDKPSIAVLPFTNMSGDPEQEYFTDGVTEDIITELSRFHSLFVIARNSSFTYKGKSPDIRQVGKELGVRYVLEGSIRKSSNRIRVTAQLIDALTGSHIWAEKYDRVLEDVFEVQEDVTRSIVTSIAPQIAASERDKARCRRPENLSAYEIGVRAWAMEREALLKSDPALREDAIRVAREALALDPQCRTASAALGGALWQKVAFGNDADRKAAFGECVAVVTRAIEIDPSDSAPYVYTAWVVLFDPDDPRWDEALSNARRAYELNPNSVEALVALGHMEGLNGDWALGIGHFQMAMRTSPRDPMICYVYQGLALGSCCIGEYVNGVEYARRGISVAPNYGLNHLYIAANYVGLNEMDKARNALATAQRLIPAVIEKRLVSSWRILRRSEDEVRMRTFLRIAAGLDSPSAADALR